MVEECLAVVDRVLGDLRRVRAMLLMIEDALEGMAPTCPRSFGEHEPRRVVELNS
jgi:hypothetical protein